ncbi:hypothetical protein JTZ10_16235 [Gordonia rubripertincta]|uniref:Uncharacterized protein n=1 Tax=Gordonia rubripertincta TaxID=36822 RepID=A0AAW4G869_GORRU|nr:hypothetical protein [Gordonia rubripertincta]MBM7279299.1 hypothetical protein [Gordonia rubripertincta]
MLADTLIPLGSAALGGFLALMGSGTTNRFNRWTNELEQQRTTIANILVEVRSVKLLANRTNNVGRAVYMKDRQTARRAIREPADDLGRKIEEVQQLILQARLRIVNDSVLRDLQSLDDSLLEVRQWAVNAVKDVAKNDKYPDVEALIVLTTRSDKYIEHLERSAIDYLRVKPPLSSRISRRLRR